MLREAMSAKQYDRSHRELKRRRFTANFEFLDKAFRDVGSGRTSRLKI
jgi:hypothetical protein